MLHFIEAWHNDKVAILLHGGHGLYLERILELILDNGPQVKG